MTQREIEFAPPGPAPDGDGWIEIPAGCWIRPTPAPRWVASPEVVRRIGVHPTTLRRWVHAGLFPEPIVFPDGTWRWQESMVDAWIATRRSPCLLARAI